MGPLIAIANIIGAIAAYFALGTASYFFRMWLGRRRLQYTLENFAIELNIPVTALDDESVVPQIAKLSAVRYSAEKFRNRLSDACGTLRQIIFWTDAVINIGIVVTAVWFTVMSNVGDAEYSWLILLVAFLTVVAQLVLYSVCTLLTGRFPGESRQGRKMLATKRLT